MGLCVHLAPLPFSFAARRSESNHHGCILDRVSAPVPTVLHPDEMIFSQGTCLPVSLRCRLPVLRNADFDAS